MTPTNADFARFRDVLSRVECLPFTFIIGSDETGSPFLQATYIEPDIYTGHPTLQKTRKWKLSIHMTNSELVQTALKCALTSAEHQVRESFLYRGQRIFGPHFDVEALVELCKDGNHLTYRPPTP